MSWKAKPQKYTAKEIAQKHHEAKMKAGGREGKEKLKAPTKGKKIFLLLAKFVLLSNPL